MPLFTKSASGCSKLVLLGTSKFRFLLYDLYDWWTSLLLKMMVIILDSFCQIQHLLFWFGLLALACMIILFYFSLKKSAACLVSLMIKAVPIAEIIGFHECESKCNSSTCQNRPLLCILKAACFHA